VKKKRNNNRQTKSKKECSVADVMDFLNKKHFGGRKVKEAKYWWAVCGRNSM